MAWINTSLFSEDNSAAKASKKPNILYRYSLQPPTSTRRNNSSALTYLQNRQNLFDNVV